MFDGPTDPVPASSRRRAGDQHLVTSAAGTAARIGQLSLMVLIALPLLLLLAIAATALGGLLIALFVG